MDASVASSMSRSQIPLFATSSDENVPSTALQAPLQAPITARPQQRGDEQCASEYTFHHVLILLGGFSANALSFGWVISSGFFFVYYQASFLSDQGPFALSWLTSLGFCCLYAVSLPLAMFCSSSTLGPKPALWIGAFLDLLGLSLLPFASNLAGIILLQALVAPFGAALVFSASITIQSKWFRRNGVRAIAITSTGGGIGGALFPLLVQSLVYDMGYDRTVYICVAINIILLGTSCITLTMPEGVLHTPYRISISRLLGNSQYLITVIGATFFMCGYYTMMAFLAAIAEGRGFSNPSTALSLASACSVLGRLLSGVIAQSRGVYNTLILFTLVAWVLTISLFANLTSKPATMAFCAIWGFFSSASISLVPSIIFIHFPLPEVPIRIGFAYSVMSLSILFGAPIGAAIVERTAGDWALIVFCGMTQALGWVLWIFARCLVAGIPTLDIV